jgi:3-hydroxyisobutyrate dehydrogenase-like beta-hydroxyacid dehydrogenase
MNTKASIKAAFIGLGVMGYPMAGHLANAGYTVTVYNRTEDKARHWTKEYLGTYAKTPAEAAEDADIVFTCVSNDAALREVLTGDRGAFAAMKKGAVLWDDSTVSAAVTKELSEEAAKLGLYYVDAPVSGGQAGAEKGVLSMMCGGDLDIIEKYEPIAASFAKNIRRIGPVGHGQMAKMCNQICIAGLVQALSESLAFGKKAGLDMEAVLSVINDGAAGSWQMKNRGETMLKGEFDFGFAVDLMRKDLGICLEAAREVSAALPVTALVDQFYGEVQEKGGGRLDTSSLITLLTKEK